MMQSRTLGSLLAAAALVWPVLAQQPAPAPVARPARARAGADCDHLDEMRAQAESRRIGAQRGYETALSFYDQMQSRGDSASGANYRRALEAYNAAFKSYRDMSMRILQMEMACMAPTPRPTMEPKGWMGITFSGDIDMGRDSTGRSVMVFTEYPTIESVEWASPAQKARVKQGDVLVAINGSDLLKGAEPFTKLLVPGKRLDLRLKRGASTVNCTLTVEPRPDSWSPTPKAMTIPDMEFREVPEPPEAPDAESWVPRMPQLPKITITPRAPGDPAGAMTVRVSYDEMTLAGAHVQRFPALKQYFGVDSGLLVLSVVPGTPAADAGLRDGDVIVGAGGKAITSPMDLSRALNAARSRASLTLEIVRQRKRRNIDLTW